MPLKNSNRANIIIPRDGAYEKIKAIKESYILKFKRRISVNKIAEYLIDRAVADVSLWDLIEGLYEKSKSEEGRIDG